MEIGYRGWHLSHGQNEVLLKSMTNQTLWESSTLEARCAHGCAVGQCITDHVCSCGVYSLKSLTEVVNHYSHLEIFGSIMNHGTVVHGTSGYRAEKSTIRVLFVDDLSLRQQLAQSYPDVEFQFRPKELVEALKKLKAVYATQDRWERARQRKNAKRKAMIAAQEAAKVKYPGGPEEEARRLRELLRGASRAQIQEFCKAYGSTLDWAERNWIFHPGGSTKAKPGDMVFATNNTSRPLVYIGSCRDSGDNASIRWCMDHDGVLVRRTLFERWDADELLTPARRKAIQEWE